MARRGVAFGHRVAVLMTNRPEFMNDVPPGGVGEIVYRGPTMMQGYWQNPGATARAFTDGWFQSCDLVRIDEDGFVYVVGRVKVMTCMPLTGMSLHSGGPSGTGLDKWVSGRAIGPS
jgi:non-ribosomal peptide synthetase component E (peptide arylation enzyme)